jgi:hypothetical protein
MRRTSCARVGLNEGNVTVYRVSRSLGVALRALTLVSYLACLDACRAVLLQPLVCVLIRPECLVVEPSSRETFEQTVEGETSRRQGKNGARCEQASSRRATVGTVGRTHPTLACERRHLPCRVPGWPPAARRPRAVRPRRVWNGWDWDCGGCGCCWWCPLRWGEEVARRWRSARERGGCYSRSRRRRLGRPRGPGRSICGRHAA